MLARFLVAEGCAQFSQREVRIDHRADAVLVEDRKSVV
jgi:hypothetical protein